MCSDFWFNSESVLTDARLPTALNVLAPFLSGGGAGLQYAPGVKGARTPQGCKGARLRRCKGARLHIYIYNYIHNKINHIKLICRDSKNNI